MLLAHSKNQSTGATMKLLAGLGIILSLTATAFAQTPPTATEAFDLRIRCKALMVEKAANFYLGPLEEILSVSWTSKYDVTSNRCYIGFYVHNFYRKISVDREVRQVYDAQTDDLLAFASIEN